MAYQTGQGWPVSSSRGAGRLAWLAAALGLVFGAGSGASAADALRQAPNSRVAMEVPESFAPSDRFSGFIDEKSGASFLIVEMPAIAYEEVKLLGDKTEALAQKGILDTKKVELAGRTGEYVYVVGKQKTAGGDYGKHILVMRENGMTAMITANVPQQAADAKTVTPQQVERAFATATVKSEAAKGEELFKLSYLGPFKETLSILGSSKAYSLSGKVPEPGTVKNVNDPVFIISPSVDKGKIPDVKAAAQNAFRAIGGLTAHEVKSEKDVTIAGLKGYEVVGEGKDAKSGTPSGMYVVVLAVDDGGYFIMAGSAPVPDMATYLPEFEKIAMGFEPKAGR